MGCSNLRVMYYSGNSVKQDIKTLLELFDKACHMGLQPSGENYTIIKNKLGL